MPTNEILEVGEWIGRFEGLNVVDHRFNELIANDVDLLHRLGEFFLLPVEFVFLVVNEDGQKNSENVLILCDRDPARFVRAKQIPSAPIVDSLPKRNKEDLDSQWEKEDLDSQWEKEDLDSQWEKEDLDS